MILIGIGANLPGLDGRPPVETCAAAVSRLTLAGLRVLEQSPWYETEPVPRSAQPNFINGVVSVAAPDLTPEAGLGICQAIEREFGRERSVANAARILDLDILAWNDARVDAPGLVIPHPKMAERAFVLLPLRDIAPNWRHPVTATPIDALIGRLDPAQAWKKLPGQAG